MDDPSMESAREKQRAREKKRLRVTMDYVPLSDDRIAPIVGYFPSGYDPLKKKNRTNPPEVNIYTHKTRPNRMELVVRPRDSNVEFVGTSYSGEAAEPQLCKYSIGILDKENQTLKIVPIAANKIFRLEPRLKVNKDEEETVEVFTSDMFRERNRELTSLYGSKKNKKLAKKLFKMQQQQNDPEAQEYLKNELQTIEINAKTLENAMDVNHNIPPYDPTADVPEKAYLLDKIIPKAEWNHLMDILEILESKDNASSSQNFEEIGYPTFVSKRIEKLQEIKDEEEKRKFARILSYISHLVNFFKISSQKQMFRSKIRAGTTAEHIPQVVFQRFISLFVDPVSQVISNEKKELLIGYILVLTLFADNFRTETRGIAKDLKMTHPSLRPFYLQLGCSLMTEENKSYFVLQVPLKLPDAIVAKKRLQRRR